MDSVRQALYSTLAGDATLTALLSSPTAIYYGVAPQSAGFPIVIFNQVTGRPVWQFSGVYVQTDLWQIKGVCLGSSPTPAEDIAKRVDALLDNGSLTIIATRQLFLRREFDVPTYSEETAGETYWHSGAQYRLITEPS